MNRMRGYRPVVRLPANRTGRDLAISDVHGCYGMMESLLRRAGFDESKDRLLMVGDMVDRGPESHRVLEWLYKSCVYAVRGNHDQFCLDSGDGEVTSFHRENGGDWFAEIDDELKGEILMHFEDLPVAMEVEGRDGRRFGFVHAECVYPDWNLFIQGLEDRAHPFEQLHLMMECMVRRDRIKALDQTPITGIDTVFVGHSSVKEKMRLGNVVYIDSGACFENGSMTLIDIHTEQVWVAKSPAMDSGLRRHLYESPCP